MREIKAAHVFWQDQAEYYFVCDDCYLAFKHLQWTGSASVDNWKAHRRWVYRKLKKGQLCQFCLGDSYPNNEETDHGAH
jgi:hypothetical protein